MQTRSPSREALVQEFLRLVDIVARLRGPDGCPWDKEQTQKSLTKYVLEEAFELAEAIDSGNQKHILDELGDYLFQVVLQAQVAQDENLFALTDILKNLSDKMIRRHPHVFGDVKAETSAEVLVNWAKIKAAEVEASPEPAKPFRLAKELRGFPALLTSYKIGKRSEDWKFDWDTPAQVEAKVTEEFREVQEAIAQKDPAAQLDEMGDLLFAVAQWARHLGIDPEAALRQGNLKFEKRFSVMIEHAKLTQDQFRALPLDEKEALWADAKKFVRKSATPT
ncbi:MAG: nucleoside triphosphate pyrophosphohydrolase [Bdellovibrionaceae bacterium]|nr:nucleoside triphosphate pyrophosphohydrolase [Pseudobdellovibrionaceae bacterium]